jgi:prophage regulatory protein
MSATFSRWRMEALKSQQRPLERLVRESERREITGVPTSTWYMLMSEGRAPKSVPLGEHSRAWILSELQDWVKARIAERDAKATP